MQQIVSNEIPSQAYNYKIKKGVTLKITPIKTLN